jgi:ribulose-phosphate 3-epimerase
MRLVVPAILPTSHRDLLEKLTYFEQIPAGRIQIDMVDGVFATPPSWPYLAGSDLHDRVQRGEMLPRLDHVKYEADLMCVDPVAIATDLINFGVQRLTVHAESTKDVGALIADMRKKTGAEANFIEMLVSVGLSIGMETDISVLVEHASEVEYVQFMAIDTIGRQGEPFNPKVIEKVKAFHLQCPEVIIQVDGGISLENAKDLVAAGASRLNIGSALLTAADLRKTVASLEAIKTPFGV